MTFRVWESLTARAIRCRGLGERETTDPSEALYEMYGGSPKVVADRASAMYWESPDDAWDLHDSFGPLRLPFDRMWIEAQVPPMIMVEGRWARSGVRAWWTMLNRMGPVSGGEDAFTVHAGMVGDEAIVLPAIAKVEVDKQGNALHGMAGYAIRTIEPPEGMAIEDAYGIPEDSIHALVEMHVKPSMLAVSLMNCRNVKLREHQRRGPKRLPRNNGAGYTYHIIELPAAVRTIGAARNGMGGGVPIHVTRGHFKTYTEDKPLFGKNVGTWWWHDHIKGDPMRGVSAHDYST